ncbi:MAG: MerR family DNA-binding transcriptional regulator [Trebonia sp.]
MPLIVVVEVNFMSREAGAIVRATDHLTVSEVAARSGFAPSALRYYEREGLIGATSTTGLDSGVSPTRRGRP